jgi:hypothetical protein
MRDKNLDDKAVRSKLISRFLVRLDHVALRGRIARIGGGNGVR